MQFLIKSHNIYINIDICDNDILIYSWNLAKHCHHMTQVLQKLRQHHLFLKLGKFNRSTVQFFGYNISPEVIQMDQGKVSAIKEWPVPQSEETPEVLRFF